MTSSSAVRLGSADERVIAARAACDPRSVRRYFAGEPIRSLTEQRIRTALETLRAEGVELVSAAEERRA